MYVLLFTTSQMKSLHYDQCLLDTYYAYVCVVSSRRNKTNPHRNKFIPVLDATRVQACKPKLSTYDQSWRTDQQDASLYVCVSWNIFNRIHVFAICDVPYVQLVRCYMKLYMIGRKVDEAASTNSSSSSYTTDFTLLHDCINTIILAEQSLHHNIILEKLDHCCVSRICTKIVIPGSHTKRLFHI